MPISGLSPRYDLVSSVAMHFAFADVEGNGTDTVYTKRKEIRVAGAGIIRIKFDLMAANALTTIFGKIYKNGSAFGTERSTASLSYVTFSEDLLVNDGDLIQLYTKASQALYPPFYRYFRFFGLPGTIVNLDT